MSGTHFKPRSVHALNKTIFLVTCSSGILAEDIDSAIKKINEWLGKSVVIICDEVTAAQLPKVIECACQTTGVESVVFNTGLDEMRTDSNPSIHSGYHSYAVLEASTMYLNKMAGIPHFSSLEWEKYIVRFKQWLCSISDARRNFSKQLVRAAINKSCVSDAVNVIHCLLPGASLDEIIEKFKWLYRSVESFDTLMQELYQIVQGKNEKVQAFLLCLKWALKAIKQQHPHAMTEQEGEHHLKDW